jgi:hypothetical protein
LGNYFANSAIYRAASANAAAAPPTTHFAFPVIFGTPAVLELEDPVATVPEPLVELAAVLPDAELPVFDAMPVVEATVLALGSAPPVSVTICLGNRVVSVASLGQKQSSMGCSAIVCSDNMSTK